MPKSILACAAGVIFSVSVLSWAQFGCSGCATTGHQVQLLSGDAGKCTTVLLTRLADGGFDTSLVPCDFQEPSL